MNFPGVIEFLQGEHLKFESARNEWEEERNQFQGQIGRLEAEVRAAETLRKDLLRRIKMLEYALRQERTKNTRRLADAGSGSVDTVIAPGSVAPFLSNFDYKPQSHHFPLADQISHRMILREFLEAVGATRMVSRKKVDAIDMKAPPELGSGPPLLTEANLSAPSSVSTDALTAELNNEIDAASAAERDPILPVSVGAQQNEVFPSPQDGSPLPPAPSSLQSLFEPPTESERVAIAKKKAEEEQDDVARLQKEYGVSNAKMNKFLKVAQKSSGQRGSRGSKSLNDLLAEGKRSAEREAKEAKEMKERAEKEAQQREQKASVFGELSELKVEDPSTKKSTSVEASADDSNRKVWKTKFTLRSHFDGVRSVAFHPTESILFSGSEDCTVKMWNLLYAGAAAGGKRTLSSPDIEPVYTFRGHALPVTSVVVESSAQTVISASGDGTIRFWKIPSLETEPYAPLGRVNFYHKACYEGHTDVIWDVMLHPYQELLFSASADETVRIWESDPSESSQPPLKTSLCFPSSLYGAGMSGFTPTGFDVCRTNANLLMTAYNSSHLVFFDIETGVMNSSLLLPRGEDLKSVPDAAAPDISTQPNCIVSHPTMDVAFSAHENKYIRFIDTKAGECVHSMVAHRDSVTSMAVDPSGLYVVSVGHDASIRFWDIRQRLCVQEISAHRRKWDETIHHVAFHPSRPLFATAGADSNIKIFQ